MRDIESSVDVWVERAALELVRRHNLDEIESVLVQAEAAPDFALKLVLLIPSAFAREHFSSEGIEFPHISGWPKWQLLRAAVFFGTYICLGSRIGAPLDI